MIPFRGLRTNHPVFQVVSATLSSVAHGGTNDPFAESNMRWWATELKDKRSRIFRLLCDHSPLLNPSAAPSSTQIAHVRVLFEAACFWDERFSEGFLYRALPDVARCYTLSESDLSFWFPTMTSPNAFLAKVFESILKNTRRHNIEDMSILTSVARCAVGKLPATISDDPTVFILLVSGSLELAGQCSPYTDPPTELVAEFDNLLGAAAAQRPRCTSA
ncbi:hypothetical protein B0H19DRAFT_1095439 [Mycena capillaripes]|nr:hypothetical protein B0H19DRAFT_1095439 [Mycena capillaripes]